MKTSSSIINLHKHCANVGIDLSSYPHDDIPAKINQLTNELTENLAKYLDNQEIDDNLLQINGWPKIVVYMISTPFLKSTSTDDDVLSGIYHPKNEDNEFHEISIEINSKLTKENFLEKKDTIFNKIKYLLHHEVGHAFKNIQYMNERGTNAPQGIYDEDMNILNYQRYIQEQEEIDSNLLMVKEQLKDLMPKISPLVFDRMGSGESFSNLFPKILNRSPEWRHLSKKLSQNQINKLMNKLSSFVLDLLSIEQEDLKELQTA